MRRVLGAEGRAPRDGIGQESRGRGAERQSWAGWGMLSTGRR